MREKGGCDGGCDVGGLANGNFADGGSDALSQLTSLKLKRALVLLGAGLSIAGDMFLRKSKYADGGVMGVLRSSFFNIPGELTIGLNNSDGKVPEPGV